MDPDAKHARILYNSQFKNYYREIDAYVVYQNIKKAVYNELGDLKGKKILFAGCGNGSECLRAIKQGARVTGIDVSDQEIAEAKKNYPKISFQIMDMEKTDFPARSFHVIVCIMAMMYKKNLTKVIQEFYRILKPKGIVVLAVPHPIRKMFKYNHLNYFVKGRKTEIWRGVNRFNYYRIIEDYIDEISKSDLIITGLKEPRPIAGKGELRYSETQYPHALILKLIKLAK